MRAAEVVETMTQLKIAAQRATKALDDFRVAYYALNERSSDPKAWDEAEELYRDLRAQMRGFNV